MQHIFIFDLQNLDFILKMAYNNFQDSAKEKRKNIQRPTPVTSCHPLHTALRAEGGSSASFIWKIDVNKKYIKN